MQSRTFQCNKLREKGGAKRARRMERRPSSEEGNAKQNSRKYERLDKFTLRATAALMGMYKLEQWPDKAKKKIQGRHQTNTKRTSGQQHGQEKSRRAGERKKIDLKNKIVKKGEAKAKVRTLHRTAPGS